MSKPSPVNKIIAELKKHDLSKSDRSLLISAITDRLAAAPLRDILYVSEDNNIFVNGKQISREQRDSLRASAENLANSAVFRVIRDQTLFASFVNASNSPTIDDLIFYKAARWWGQQEDKYIQMLTDKRYGNATLPGEDN